MILHHPSEAMLIAYGAGQLPEAHRIVMRAHLARCPQCAQAANLACEIGGVLLDEIAPVAMEAHALETTLARLDLRDARAPRAPVPTSVADFATGRWWWIGPGIRIMPLRRRDRDDTRLDLLRVAPGVALPGHGHSGFELTCVLQGGFRDETGDYLAGDMAEGDAKMEHRPEALRLGEECICLVATTGRLRAHDWLARLVQPLIGV